MRCKNITLDDWEDFIQDPTRTRMLESTKDINYNPPPGLAGSSGISSHQLTFVESFKRIIKRYSSQFASFKERKYWNAWRRNSLATARAQDMDKVLYLDYTPLTQEEMNLFSEKQKFVHSVFSTTLQTDRGKNFLESTKTTSMLKWFIKSCVDFTKLR